MGRSVIAQQYSSVTFVPLPFHSGREKFSAFEKLCYFIFLSVFKIACLKLRKWRNICILYCFVLPSIHFWEPNIQPTTLQAFMLNLSASLLHGAKLFLRSWYQWSWSENSQLFMEAEGSLSCQTNPVHAFPLTFIKMNFNIIPSFAFPNGFLPSGFPTKILYAFLSVTSRPALGTTQLAPV